MNRCPNSRRLGLAIALALPLTVIFTVGVLHAQPGFQRPGNLPQPPFIKNPIQPIKPNWPKKIEMPKLERVWTCGACHLVIGKGDRPPATCPHCKARIINGVGEPNIPPMNHNPVMKPPGNNNPVVNNPVVIKKPRVVNNRPVHNNPPVNNGGVNGRGDVDQGGGVAGPANPANQNSGGMSSGAVIGTILAGLVAVIGAGGMVFAGILWLNKPGQAV